MIIKADRERCIGSGMCVLTAPELFDQDPDDGRVVLRVDGVDPDRAAAAVTAADLCPSRALSVQPEP